MRVFATLVALGVLAFPQVARGSTPAPLRADLVEARSVKLDGVPKEWAAGLDKLGEIVKGKPERADLSARALLAYDDANLYVAADVVDDHLAGGTDRVVVVLGFPGGATHEIALYPGEPGKSAGSARLDGATLASAKVIEAPESDGYTLEARIPWAAIPGTSEVRVGLRAGLFVHDGDGGAVDAIVGSAAGATYAALPPLWTEPEQALWDGLVKQKGLAKTPSRDVLADIDGDGMKERILAFGSVLVVLGPRFREGKQYFYGDLGADADQGAVPRFEARDVTGDGKAELLLEKRFGTAARYREMFEVLGFAADGAPRSLFRHETAVVTEVGAVRNTVRFVAAKPGQALVVEGAPAKGFDASNYHEATESAFPALLLPWGATKSQRYEVRGGVFAEVGKESQTPAPAPAPAPAPSPPPASTPPRALTRAEVSAKLLEQWRRDRHLTGAPRFDLSVDVTGSSETERVVLLGRELGVLGTKTGGASGYGTFTLTAFATPDDITSLTARDLTGDGKAELLVRGVQRAPAPKPLEGGTFDRELLLVLDASSGSPKRIFAAELGLAHGSRRLSAALRFVDAKTGAELEITAEKPVGWSQSTYPFAASDEPLGDVEPLPLPWTSAPSRRYRWSQGSFTRL